MRSESAFEMCDGGGNSITAFVESVPLFFCLGEEDWQEVINIIMNPIAQQQHCRCDQRVVLIYCSCVGPLSERRSVELELGGNAMHI